MKKIILVILLFGLIIFATSKQKQDPESENTISKTFQQTTSEPQNMTKPEEPTNPIPEKNLDGQTIAFIGDSLIEGYGNDFHGFDYYLAQDLPNTTFINHSKSGSTITDNSGTDNIIMHNQAKTLTGNPDIIVFDGGANDIMGYSLGFLNPALKKEMGTVDMNSTSISNGETVIADLEEVVQELKNKFPDAKLCYFQPFLLDDDTLSHMTQEKSAQQEIATRRDQFYQEIQKLCTKWQIDYLDVSTHFVGTGTTYRQDDWIHIKAEGYKVLTPFLLQKLKEM